MRELLPSGTQSTWLAMIRSRNHTSHNYNPALAEEVAQLIANQYGKELLGLQQELRHRAEPTIPGIPQADSQQLLELMHAHPMWRKF